MSDTEPKLVYSGRVPRYDMRDPKWREDSEDLMNIRVFALDDTEEFMFIEIFQPSLRINLRLDRYQARMLRKCMENSGKWRDKP